MHKPGPISAKPLSVLLSDVFSDAYAKQGFAARELVTRWAEIAGPEDRRPFRAAEDPVAAAGGGAAAGTGHAGAAGGGPDGAGNPACLRRHPAAGQPLLRLERGGAAGAAAGAAVAPGPAPALPRAGRRRRWRKSPKPCPRSRTRNCGPRWRGSAPRSSEIEPAARPRAAACHCHNCGFKLANTTLSFGSSGVNAPISGADLDHHAPRLHRRPVADRA